MQKNPQQELKNNPHDVIDKTQLRQIESVHRGFLYQHLFAVGCLFKLAGQEKGAVAVERDEDVEITTNDGTIYVQVKYRSNPLARSDIKTTLERFDRIRSEPNSKRFQFLIVSSSELGPQLTVDVKDRTWPVDVAILTPTSRNTFSDRVPCVWFSLEEAVTWCYAAAGNLPFGTLRPETLVWKLAACVQFAATGDDASRRDHLFAREDLPVLFEQLVDQLQEFPSTPLEYRPQADEPVFIGDEQTRLIVGFSGAGKTTWASWQAQHSSAACAYFGVVDPQGSDLAKALARELAARFVIGQPESAALFPAFSGIEALQCLNGRLRPDKAPVVVMDNVHQVEPEEIKRVIGACSNIRFILLAQPGSNATRLAAMMEIEVECLKGWDADTVASVFATEGSVIGPGTAKNWRLTTGGLPLYVKNSARLCIQRYEGNAEVFWKEVSHGNHLDGLAQESILRMTIEDLSSDEASLVAVMSLASLRLTPSEIEALADALP